MEVSNMSSKNKIHRTTSDWIFDIINAILLTFALIVVLYPIIYIFSASISDPTEVISGRMWLWPVKVNFEGYKVIFNHEMIGVGYLNSLYYMFFCTLLNLFMTVIAAYPLSRKDLYGKSFFTFIFVFTMFFGGGLIPTYLLIKDLGLINTRAVMIIPGAMSVWNVIITRTYIQSNLPDELLEASKIDGCSDFRFLWSVVVPLSTPVLAVVALFCAVGSWNSYFNALIYLRDKKLYPLQIVLRNILILNQKVSTAAEIVDPKRRMQEEQLRHLLKYSLIVVANIPMFIIYPFIQKYFVKGVMIGAIKG